MKTENIPDLEQIEYDPKAEDAVVRLPEIVSDFDTSDTYTPCGYKKFDEAMDGGFRGGDLVIISGISGHGKTSLAQTLTYNLCKREIPTLWFSYEVSVAHLHRKFERMGISEFYHVYTPKKNTTGKLDWIKSKIREGIVRYNTQVVFIDHIDFLKSTKTKSQDNEAIALKNIAIEIKDLAVELDVTIVMMAHVKKLPNDSEPNMQDIGYSAGIFQLADYVMMVWRKKDKFNKSQVYGKDSCIKIVKNRMTGHMPYLNVTMENEKLIATENAQPSPAADRAAELSHS